MQAAASYAGLSLALQTPLDPTVSLELAVAKWLVQESWLLGVAAAVKRPAISLTSSLVSGIGASATQWEASAEQEKAASLTTCHLHWAQKAALHQILHIWAPWAVFNKLS